MHAADDVKLRHAAMSELLFHEGAGDDADDFSLLRKSPVRDGSHQAHIPTAIDEPDAALREKRTQIMRGGAMEGIAASGGATVNTDSAQSGHGGMMNDFCLSLIHI